MASSHKSELNMSSIDWPCRMNTVKERELSASHLGVRRMDAGGRRTNTQRRGVVVFLGSESFVCRVAACPYSSVGSVLFTLPLYYVSKSQT